MHIEKVIFDVESEYSLLRLVNKNYKRKIKKTNKRVKEIEVEVSELIKDAKLKQELIDVAMLKKGKR